MSYERLYLPTHVRVCVCTCGVTNAKESGPNPTILSCLSPKFRIETVIERYTDTCLTGGRDPESKEYTLRSTIPNL